MFEKLLFLVRTLGVLVSFHDNIGSQRLYEADRPLFEANNEVDIRERGHAVDAQVERQADARIAVGVNPDDEEIRLLACKLQQAQVAGMNDVEVARDEG